MQLLDSKISRETKQRIKSKVQNDTSILQNSLCNTSVNIIVSQHKTRPIVSVIVTNSQRLCTPLRCVTFAARFRRAQNTVSVKTVAQQSNIMNATRMQTKDEFCRSAYSSSECSSTANEAMYSLRCTSSFNRLCSIGSKQSFEIRQDDTFVAAC